MRDLKHYLKMFSSNPGATFGRSIVAKAIYAGRYGYADNPDTDILREIVRGLPGDVAAADAADTVSRRLDWTSYIEADPIPDWALKAAISERGLTQAGFADQMGVALRTVQDWAGGRRNCSGPTAKMARMILTDGMIGNEA